MKMLILASRQDIRKICNAIKMMRIKAYIKVKK